MASQNEAQRRLVDASVADNRDGIVRDGPREQSSQGSRQQDADGCTRASQRYQHDGAGASAGDQASQRQQMTGEARLLAFERLMEDMQVAGRGKAFGGDHLAVVLLPRLNEA